jgi:hypothetical protein
LLSSCKQTDGSWRRGGGEDWKDTEVRHNTDDTGEDSADSEESGETSESGDTGDTNDTADTGEIPEYVGTGYTEGDIAFDLRGATQTGADWTLYAHDGGPVVLVFGYAQGYNFQAICGYLPDLELDFASRGVSFATVLLLDEVGTVADQADASSWARTWGLSTVLWDKHEEIAYVWASPTQVKVMVIDANMEITWVHLEATPEAQLEDKIRDLLYG